MSLRLIEVFLPQQKTEQVKALCSQYSFLGVWYEYLANDRLLVRILLYAKEVEPVIDRLEALFTETEGFRLLLLQVEASVPRPELLEASVSEPEFAIAKPNSLLPRISREELYVNITQSIKLSWTQNLMVLLSTLIAAIGLLEGSEAVIIGAMVIAPLLKPNMALAVATTLGDKKLAFKTIKVGAVGIIVALILSIVIGSIFPVSPNLPEITFRTKVSLTDVILALASGVAGAISLTSGETSAIVGVMVSVALLPPLVTFGMLLGAQQWIYAEGAMLLVLTNLVCLNLASVITLLIQNLSPGAVWEVYYAKRITQWALGIWLLLLTAMVGLILVWQRH